MADRFGEFVPEPPAALPARPGLLYARGVVAGALLAGAIYFAARREHPTLAIGGLFFYLVVAPFVRVRPDYRNVGLVGGLIDHPFRWSDNVNRGLIFAQVVLMPGRFVIGGLRDAVAAWRMRRELAEYERPGGTRRDGR